MKSLNLAVCACVAAVMLWAAAPASAVILTDAEITSTTQLRTAQQNPYFTGPSYAFQQDLAGVNFYYDTASHTVPGGTTLLGVGFDNIDLTAPAPPGPASGPYTLVENGSAPFPQVTLDLPFTGDNTVRTQSVSASGTDGSVLSTVGTAMFYIGGSGHPSATFTFSGLQPNSDLLVQMIGGHSGWNGTLKVDANGDSVGIWSTVSSGSNGSLFAFDTTSDALGQLSLHFTIDDGNFAGIAGLMLSQGVTVPPIPEPSTLLLLGAGLLGLAYRPSRRRALRAAGFPTCRSAQAA